MSAEVDTFEVRSHFELPACDPDCSHTVIWSKNLICRVNTARNSLDFYSITDGTLSKQVTPVGCFIDKTTKVCADDLGRVLFVTSNHYHSDDAAVFEIACTDTDTWETKLWFAGSLGKTYTIDFIQCTHESVFIGTTASPRSTILELFHDETTPIASLCLKFHQQVAYHPDVDRSSATLFSTMDGRGLLFLAHTGQAVATLDLRETGGAWGFHSIGIESSTDVASIVANATFMTPSVLVAVNDTAYNVHLESKDRSEVFVSEDGPITHLFVSPNGRRAVVCASGTKWALIYKVLA